MTHTHCLCSLSSLFISSLSLILRPQRWWITLHCQQDSVRQEILPARYCQTREVMDHCTLPTKFCQTREMMDHCTLPTRYCQTREVMDHCTQPARYYQTREVMDHCTLPTRYCQTRELMDHCTLPTSTAAEHFAGVGDHYYSCMQL